MQGPVGNKVDLDELYNLIQCLKEFTACFQQSLHQMQGNVSTLSQHLHRIQSQHPKHQLFRQPTTKQPLTKERIKAINKINVPLKTDSTFSPNQISSLLKTKTHIIDLDPSQQIQYFNQDSVNDKGQIDQFVSFDLNFQEEDFQRLSPYYNNSEKNWNSFLDYELNRIGKVDALASKEDILKFSENKWKDMNSKEKQKWGKMPAKKLSLPKKERAEQADSMQTKIKAFLQKRLKVKKEEQHTREFHSVESEKKVEIDVKPSVTAAELVSALKESRQQSNKLQQSGQMSTKMQGIIKTFGI